MCDGYAARVASQPQLEPRASRAQAIRRTPLPAVGAVASPRLAAKRGARPL